MSFTFTPTITPSSAYRPIIFQTQQTYADVVEWAHLTATINGQPYPVLSVPKLSSSISPNWEFEFDIQQLVRSVLAPFSNVPSDCFGDINVPHVSLSSNCIATFSVSVKYQYRDPATGLLVDLGVTDNSSTFYAINGTIQHGKLWYLNGFDSYKPANTNRLWMTNNPNIQDGTGAIFPTRKHYVHPNENLWIGFLSHSSANRIRVRARNSAGIVISEGQFTADISPNYEPQSIGIGMANLLTQVYDISGSVDMTDPVLDSYVIDLIDGAANQQFKSLILFVDRVCQGEFRLHWLNLLGQPDAYTFPKINKGNIKTTYSTAQAPLPYTEVISDKGKYRLESTGTENWEAESDPLDPLDAHWLSEIALSNEVYLETPDGLLPVIVTLQETPVQSWENDSLNLVTIKVTVESANDIIIQNN